MVMLIRRIVSTILPGMMLAAGSMTHHIKSGRLRE
jgi:hypothetical protein